MSSSGPPSDADDSDSTVLDESGNVEPGVLDKEFFEALVENGSDAIVSIDENSRILFANRSVERVFGYEPDELVGEPLTTIMPERFHDAHHEAIERYLETGERTLDWRDVELPAKHADGHEVQLSITFEEHRYDGERVFSGIMRDVTDRVERERELERQNEQLERFASFVSHDLRDPLQTAKADVAILESEYGTDELFDELDETLDRMDALIDDVLTLAKQGKTIGETATVELPDVARAAWRTAGVETATLDVEDDIGSVRADRERLETLFQNLFRNAVQHAGADVTVRVGALPDGFYVADDGPGFGTEAPEDLFEYGYTTDESGTGFGLSIVGEIADAHGWAVSATSGETGGARFEFHGATASREVVE
ncbi:PAS domain-containing sensor histidine kinase [Halarchaeum sp. CBA1220]|uniref:PAS domain S-box protein n=1 Tax=Halarchaeum sp. CBA1220 TaxID=1853682 RepID=UPI000F3A8B99|nr:PAS domain-containing sensor histidine kinase [Halarchaeum sp. CBA1220]QLC34520.1 PAS domain-containing sensor histidine kinase [Halarchaeum sp. CBA1220]